MWWIFKSKKQQLPRATGPYVPGLMDIMTDYAARGLFMSIYYPTDNEYDETKFSKWLPNTSYLLGIAKVIMIYPLVVKLMAWFFSANEYVIPAIYGGKIKTGGKFKCLIFSHGLGAYRRFYSNIACELASRGFVVICVEHRDNSACHTYYYQSEEHAKSNYRTSIDFKIYSLGDKHYENRNRQVHYRSNECSRILDLLLNINKGEIPENVIEKVPTTQKIDFNLSDLAGNLNVDDIFIGGHSFGAATALLTLSRRKELKLGLLFDPWMFPIKTESVPENINQPLLFVNTQTFHIEPNTKAMDKYLGKKGREMYTIKHSTHENHSDSVLVFGYWLNWFMKKLDPQLALRINNCLVLRFLHTITGYPENVVEFEDFLRSQEHNFECGLTRPWA